MKKSNPDRSGLPRLAVLTALACALAACSGGGSSSGTSGSAAKRTPPIVEAVPADPSPAATLAAAAKLSVEAMHSRTQAEAQGLPTGYQKDGTDYSTAPIVRYLWEPVLNRYDWLDELLAMIGQTGYPQMVNAGPYLARVSQPATFLGDPSRELETWTVQADEVPAVDGSSITQVQIWMDDPATVKVLLMVWAGPSQGEDGTDLDLGSWTLDSQFIDPNGGPDQPFLAAEAWISDPVGTTFLGSSQMSWGLDSQAVLRRTATDGYGKMSFPAWTPDGIIPWIQSYAYNPGQLVQHRLDSNPGQLTYKDRSDPAEIYAFYNLYDAATGDDVRRHKRFEMPVSYSNSTGAGEAWYETVNGRHQLVRGRQQLFLPKGTTVLPLDAGKDASPLSAATYHGTLTKWTPIDQASLDDLLNIPIHAKYAFEQTLTWDGSQWVGPDNQPYPNLASLASDPYFFVTAVGPDGRSLAWNPYADVPGFFDATFDPDTGQPYPTISAFTPNDNDTVEVFGEGDLFLAYQGPAAGWVRRRPLFYDSVRDVPVFSSNFDEPFLPELGTEFVVDNPGIQGKVTRLTADPDTYEFDLESGEVVNPGNVTTLLDGVSGFKVKSRYAGSSVYQFGTDPTQADFLTMSFKTESAVDREYDAAPRSPAMALLRTSKVLSALDADGNDMGVSYQWDYPSQLYQSKGSQTFLYGGSATSPDWLLLDNPIQLAPVALPNTNKVATLSYDGWVYGIPSWNFVLEDGEDSVNASLADRIVNIPMDMVVPDRQDPSQAYVFKPRLIEEFLEPADQPDTTLAAELDEADCLDLGNEMEVPTLKDNGMGPQPADAPLQFQEGLPVSGLLALTNPEGFRLPGR